MAHEDIFWVPSKVPEWYVKIFTPHELEKTCAQDRWETSTREGCAHLRDGVRTCRILQGEFKHRKRGKHIFCSDGKIRTEDRIIATGLYHDWDNIKFERHHVSRITDREPTQ